MKKIALFAVVASLAGISNAQTMFSLTVENFGPQPLSPTFWSASDGTFNIFSLGGSASSGIKSIAETGNTSNMSSIAMAAGSSVSAFGTLSGGPIMPGQTRTVQFTTDSLHPYLSFASMLGMTNDGFIGESVSTSGLNLWENGVPRGFSMLITGLRAWDAGTELNTQNAADLAPLGGSGNPADSVSFIRIHDTIIPGVGDSWQQLPDWTVGTSLARVSVAAVPEPTSMMALGLGVLTVLRRRKK